MLFQRDEQLIIEGQGDSELAALNHVFSQIKPLLEEKSSDVIIRLEPKDMEIVYALHHTHTEKLFGLFFPRQKSLFKIKARITVAVSSINVSSIKYRHEKEELSPLRHILEMR